MSSWNLESRIRDQRTGLRRIGEPPLDPPDEPAPDYGAMVEDIAGRIMRMIEDEGAVLYAEDGKVMLTVCDEERGDPIPELAVEIET